MRRLLPLVLVLVSGCGGAATTATTVAEQTTTTSAPTTDTEVPATTAGVPETTLAGGASAGAIPAECAEGFTEYLVVIEPVVAAFDPATANVGEFFEFDDAVGEKGIELMSANNSTATYSCSEVGLEFAYFDSRSPWDRIFEIAQNEAPGTVPYLEVVRRVAAIDQAQLSDYGVEGCDVAVERIRQAVAEQTAAGNEDVGFMGIDEGLELLGLYNSYLAEVREGTCPPDELGNDEFGFMAQYG